jgi:hypothetical protein
MPKDEFVYCFQVVGMVEVAPKTGMPVNPVGDVLAGVIVEVIGVALELVEIIADGLGSEGVRLTDSGADVTPALEHALANRSVGTSNSKSFMVVSNRNKSENNTLRNESAGVCAREGTGLSLVSECIAVPMLRAQL